jgi:hypothetical protein
VSNNLLTIDMITREAVRLWKNSNNFIQKIDHQYDSSFAVQGAKIGTSLRIRLPNDYTVNSGPVASVQDTNEQYTTLNVTDQENVAVSFNSVDRTMKLDDYSEIILAPMMNNLVGKVAQIVMNGVEGGISNFVSLVDGSNNIISPTAKTWLQGGAKLDQLSARRGVRQIIMDPLTQANTVSSLSGLFNPSPTISKQFQSGEMMQALGFDWAMDQTTLVHTTATYTDNITVSGANQTGTTLVTSAITGGLNKGDIIEIEDVNLVNRITKQNTHTLAQFVVTADVATGGTSVPIYPAIIPAGAGGSDVQYQTVDASPASGADVSPVTKPGERYRKNFAFVPEAVTLATADLVMPGGVMEASRQNYDGVSLRMVTQYQIGTDQAITRLDVLFGFLWIRPEWACVIADVV